MREEKGGLSVKGGVRRGVGGRGKEEYRGEGWGYRTKSVTKKDKDGEKLRITYKIL